MATENACGAGCNCGAGAACGCGSGGTSHSSGGGHSRSLCRIHGVLGLYLAGFMLVHLGLNALAVRPARYASLLAWLYGRPDLIKILSLVLVILPLSVQITTGLLRVVRGGLRGRCRHGPLPPWAQRISGLVILVFLAIHLFLTKVVAPFDLARPMPSASHAVIGLTGPLTNQLGLALLTVIALWAVGLHVGNGILTALRFVVSRPKMQEQPAVRAICAAVGLVLITAGFCGWTALLVQSHSVQPAALAQAQPHEHR